MLPSIIAGTPGSSPTDFTKDYRVTQRFGSRPEVYGSGGHNGIDIAPKRPGLTGVRVRAPHEGFVSLRWAANSYGLYVMIVSDVYGPDRRRRVSILAHADSFLVPDGSFIYQFQDVMIMGKTGFADGIHTHWTYYVTDEMGRKLNLDNGHGGALDIAKEVVVDGGKTLSQFLPSLSKVAKASTAKPETCECDTIQSPEQSEYIPLPPL